MPRKLLRAYGILLTLVYVATGLIGSVSTHGYLYASPAVSELSGIGAPVKAQMP